MCSGASAGDTFEGATGSIVRTPDRGPSAPANAPAGRISETCASPVVGTAVLLPLLPSATSTESDVGLLLVAARPGGGSTHRYAVGGARPSSSGFFASGD